MQTDTPTPPRLSPLSAILVTAIVTTCCFCCYWVRPPERAASPSPGASAAAEPAALEVSPPFDLTDESGWADSGWTGVTWESVNKQHVSGTAYNPSDLFVWCHNGGALQVAVRASPLGRTGTVLFGVESGAQPALVEGTLDRPAWLWHHPRPLEAIELLREHGELSYAWTDFRGRDRVAKWIVADAEAGIETAQHGCR